MSRLLICVQAVDLDDPLFGFFVSWLEEAAKQFGQITVLALRVGRFDLPENVTVIRLREPGASKLSIVRMLWRESWQRRKTYDGVFVRGDSIYVILAGWLWRLLGKRVVFWFAHYRVSRLARLAARLAHLTVSSSQAAAVGLPRLRIIGQGIEVTRFPFVERLLPSDWKLLVFGRMDRSKSVDVLLHAFQEVGTGLPCRLQLIGRANDSAYEQRLDMLVRQDARIEWKKQNVPYSDLPALLSEYPVILNATDGSLDKTIIEGALSGVIPLATTSAMLEWLPTEAVWLHWRTEAELRVVVERLLSLSATDYIQLQRAIRTAAETRHTTRAQIQRLSELLS